MSHRWLFTVLYALHLFWTGLWRSIEAHAFKPNAFYFCLTLGAIVLVGAYLYRIGKDKAATAVTGATVLIVLAFYVYCFITNAEEDASFRVALIIVSSVAELVVISFPAPRGR